MKKPELKQLVIDEISVIGTYNDPEEVKGSDHFRDDLGKDSLDFVEFIMHIEKALNISIPDEELEGKENFTIDEMTDYIYSKL